MSESDPKATPSTAALVTKSAATAVIATPSRFVGERELDFDRMPGGLTDQQKIVLHALFNHHSCEEAADRAGCNRASIYRWRARQDAFRTAYNLMRLEQKGNTHADCHSLAADALLGLRLAIAQGDDPRLNLALLKALGYLRPQEPEPLPELDPDGT